MMFITGKAGLYVTWHVGKALKLPTTAVMDMDMITADCDELDYILARFQNLPTVKGARVVTWTGDMARFIYENLCDPASTVGQSNTQDTKADV